MHQIGLTVHSILSNWYRTRAPKPNLFQKIKCFLEKYVNCDVLPCCLNLSHKIYENILEQMSYKKQMSEHLFLVFERFCQYDIQILLAYVENVLFWINLQQSVPFGKLARLPETFHLLSKKNPSSLLVFGFLMEGQLFCCTWMLNRYLSPQTTKKWLKKTGGWILFQRSEMVGGVILGKMHGHLWEKPVWDSHLIHQSRPCP